MQEDKLLLKAKSQLTLKHPYFGMLASRLKHESSESIRGYASNGVRFIYNPEFISNRSIDEIMFILTNCVMHHILAHQQRRLGRKGSLWQLATDYAINNMLHANGLKIPPGANYNEDFEKMYAEEIYILLKEEYFSSIDDAFDEDHNNANDTPVPNSLTDEQTTDTSDIFSIFKI